MYSECWRLAEVYLMLPRCPGLCSACQASEPGRWAPFTVCASADELPCIRAKDARQPLHLMRSEAALLATAVAFGGAPADSSPAT